jgi:hypothetical protein
MLAAMKLYELGQMSAGAAAELAGVTRIAFLAQSSERTTSRRFQLAPVELEQDLQRARRAAADAEIAVIAHTDPIEGVTTRTTYRMNS